MKKQHFVVIAGTLYGMLTCDFVFAKPDAAPSKPRLVFSYPYFPPLYRQIEESDMVGVFEVVGVSNGKLPLLRLMPNKLFKGSYPWVGHNAYPKPERYEIFLDLHSRKWKANGVEYNALADFDEFKIGSLYFGFIKRTTQKMEQNSVAHIAPFGSILPFKDNTIIVTRYYYALGQRGMGYGLRSTYDYLAAVEKLAAIEKVKDRKRKMALLQPLVKSRDATDNLYLFEAAQTWLKDLKAGKKS